jgi:hypothetical protein
LSVVAVAAPAVAPTKVYLAVVELVELGRERLTLLLKVTPQPSAVEVLEVPLLLVREITAPRLPCLESLQVAVEVVATTGILQGAVLLAVEEEIMVEGSQVLQVLQGRAVRAEVALATGELVVLPLEAVAEDLPLLEATLLEALGEVVEMD